MRYLTQPIVQVKSKDGETIAVKNIRQREKFAPSIVYIYKLKSDEILRPDIAANRIYSQPGRFENILEVTNDRVLDMDEGEEIHFLHPDFVRY